MSEPFYRSVRKINTIGLILAILAIIVFIVSCLLNVYVYAITPTATPTASNTPTATKTPRPSSTPTSTPTLTDTPTPEIPTFTETPLSIFSQEPFLTLEGILAENNFECIPQDSVESGQTSITCTKSLDNVSIQLFFIDQFAGNLQAEFIAAPFIQEQRSVISEEFIWLTLQTSVQLWPEPSKQTATVEATPSETAPEPNELSQWIDSTIKEISEGDIFQTTISGLDIEVSMLDSQLRLSLGPSSTSTENNP